MSYALSWLPAVLRAAGLKVAEQPGWLTRGHGDMGPVKGVMCHHTGNPNAKIKNIPTLGGLTRGVTQANGKFLPGPLAQLGLAVDGTFYVIAAGRCNHAGTGSWRGLTQGNSSFVAIEAEHTGQASDPWPEVQLDAYRRGVAAILKYIGSGADYCCGHREYALPKGRKNDPVKIDMDEFRAKVAALMEGQGVISHPVIPFIDSHARPTLRRGSRGDAVKIVQTAVGVGADGVFGPATEAAVRQFQREHNLVPDGIVGPKSWALIPGAEMAKGLAHQEPNTNGVVSSANSSDAPSHQPERLVWGQKVSALFRSRVVAICKDLRIEPDHLMACMAFESGGTFSPSQKNLAGSGATGLIQFMPDTAVSLGTTTKDLALMTAEEQLLYVDKYFRPYRGRLSNLGDLYMAILFPAGIGKLDDFPLFVEGQKPIRRYQQNRGLDVDRDGIVTRGEACKGIVRKLTEGAKPENLFLRDDTP